MQKKELLHNAKTIAILGISSDTSKPSYKVAEFLHNKGYCILPISPKGGVILGKRVYTNLQEAFEVQAIDILNVFRKSEALLDVAKEVLALKHPPKCVWVQLGLENAEAKEVLENAGIFYVENCCIKLEYERIFNDSNF